MEKTIRIWDGCKVLGLVTVSQDGTWSSVTQAGGAENGARADVEIDPFKGFIVTGYAPTPIAYTVPEE
jgi:hypothetical protein